MGGRQHSILSSGLLGSGLEARGPFEEQQAYISTYSRTHQHDKLMHPHALVSVSHAQKSLSTSCGVALKALSFAKHME